MAIIPSRDNFQVGVQPFGARVSGAPAPADVTRNTRVLAQGLMAADRMADDKAKTDAMYALSRYQESLDRLRYDQNDGFSVRKGDAANRNTDGSSVWEEYQNRVRKRGMPLQMDWGTTLSSISTSMPSILPRRSTGR